MAILQRPFSRIDLETALHRGRDAGLDEHFAKHRKPVLDDRSAKKEGIHETGREYRRVARVTEAKYPL